ncbi:hypothetical protein AAF712_012901 [Marasmius tenuissimus]|uniref:Protein kinase domain-containing protein n=1 Tax=Marasmius tenuissimus TaxID=585030 RepID=A0ABR2ZGJ8_9AGAR
MEVQDFVQTDRDEALEELSGILPSGPLTEDQRDFIRPLIVLLDEGDGITQQGLPRSALNLNLPDVVELSSEKTDALLGVDKLHVPTVESLDRMAKEEHPVWTKYAIDRARRDVQDILCLSEHKKDMGDSSPFVAIEAHIKFVGPSEVDLEKLLPPSLLSLLAHMLGSEYHNLTWPSEITCLGWLGELALELGLTLSGSSSGNITTCLRATTGKRFSSYAPVCDFRVSASQEVASLVLWGEIESHCAGRDHTKARVVMNCFANLWMQYRIKGPIRFLTLFVDPGKSCNFTVFDVAKVPGSPPQYELKRYTRIVSNKYYGALDFMKVAYGLLRGISTTVSQREYQLRCKVLSLKLEDARVILSELESRTSTQKGKKRKRNTDEDKDDEDFDPHRTSTKSAPQGSHRTSSRGQERQGGNSRSRNRSETQHHQGNKRSMGTHTSQSCTAIAQEGEALDRLHLLADVDAESAEHHFSHGHSSSKGDLYFQNRLYTHLPSNNDYGYVGIRPLQREADFLLEGPLNDSMLSIVNSLLSPMGTGQVLLLKHHAEDEPVAVAKLTSHNEVKILRQLKGLRGVVNIIEEQEVDEDEDVHLVITQYAGRNLRSYCKTGGGEPLPPMKVVLGLLDAMQTIHSAGFAHCDIKADNIAISANPPGVIVLDFGEACEVKHSGTGDGSAEEDDGGDWIPDPQVADIRRVGELLVYMVSKECFAGPDRKLVVVVGQGLVLGRLSLLDASREIARRIEDIPSEST